MPVMSLSIIANLMWMYFVSVPAGAPMAPHGDVNIMRICLSRASMPPMYSAAFVEAQPSVPISMHVICLNIL